MDIYLKDRLVRSASIADLPDTSIADLSHSLTEMAIMTHFSNLPETDCVGAWVKIARQREQIDQMFDEDFVNPSEVKFIIHDRAMIILDRKFRSLFSAGDESEFLNYRPIDEVIDFIEDYILGCLLPIAIMGYKLNKQ
jgi:hypothetical protein